METASLQTNTLLELGEKDKKPVSDLVKKFITRFSCLQLQPMGQERHTLEAFMNSAS